jgi:hypothetical protein
MYRAFAILKENAMNEFLAHFAGAIQCSLGCFDRLLFKGYLPISHPASMERWLTSRGLLLKDFKRFTTAQSERLKVHAQQLAAKAGRPYQYLSRPIRKDDEAQRIAQRDHLTEGLICVFAILEQAQSFQLRYGEAKPRLLSTQPRCLCLYFYYLDRDFGLMHLRLQTWFPFTVQIYVNGHSWLQRQLQRRHLAYTAQDNAFTSLADPLGTQRLADKLPRLNWPRRLALFARRINPLLADLLEGMTCYWVTDQAEYATDLLFRDAATLARLYPQGLRQGQVVVGCFPMAKRVSNLPRYAAIAHAANGRYLQALAAATDPARAYRQLQVLCRPVQRDGRRHRALNPLSRRDSELFQAVLRGEHHLRGFRAATVAHALGWPSTNNPTERQRHSARLNRRLRLLRAHGLIAKIPHSHHGRVTVVGVTRMSAILHLQTQPLPAPAMSLAA